MNVFRYKNNIKLNIFNSIRPEIDGHAICLFNVETHEFRLWKFGTWGGLTWYRDTPITEITNISEEIKEDIIHTVKKRLMMAADSHRPSGAWELRFMLERRYDSRDIERTGNSKYWKYYPDHNSEDNDLYFIFDNYVGDINAPIFDMTNEYKSFFQYCSENLNEKIVKTQ